MNTHFIDGVVLYTKMGGGIGNYMFFMMSGFLITATYKKRIAYNLSFLEFFLKRFLKMLPLFYFGTIFTLITYWLFDDFSKITIDNLVLNAFMINTCWVTGDGEAAYNTATWFVGALLLCYIIFYCIVRFTRKHPNLYYIMVGFMIVWGASLIRYGWDLPFNYRTNGEGYLNFFTGVLLFEVFTTAKEKNYDKILQIVNAIVLILEFVLIKCDLEVNTYGWTLMCLCILYIVIDNTYISRALSFKPLAKLGKISMEIFFIHLPLAGLMMYVQYEKHLIYNNQGIGLILYMLILLITATLVHFCFTKNVDLYKIISSKKK